MHTGEKPALRRIWNERDSQKATTDSLLSPAGKSQTFTKVQIQNIEIQNNNYKIQIQKLKGLAKGLNRLALWERSSLEGKSQTFTLSPNNFSLKSNEYLFGCNRKCFLDMTWDFISK